jgi:hypothetical protein
MIHDEQERGIFQMSFHKRVQCLLVEKMVHGESDCSMHYET